MSRLGAALLGAWLLVALAGPRLVGVDPLAVDTAARLRPPSAAHLLGTDQFGRDVLARVVAGAGYALAGLALSTLLAAAAGTVLGAAAGLAGGSFDAVLGRLLDLWLSLPALLFAVAIVGAFGPSYANAMLAIGFMRVPSFARLGRVAVYGIRGAPYLEGARAIGAPWSLILWRYALPNVSGPLVAFTAVRGSTALLAGSALSFVGLGAPVPEPEWGALVAGGRPYLDTAPWIAGFPCLALVLLALSLQLSAGAGRSRIAPGTLL